MILQHMDSRIAQLDKAVNGFIGAVLLIPAFTMLGDTGIATQVLDLVMPHAPQVVTKILAGCLTAAAGYFLSHTMREDKDAHTDAPAQPTK